MKTAWDYTNLAAAYVNRPDYAPEALQSMLKIMGLKEKAHVCDIGAGVGHLTIPLLEEGFNVVAVEPNDAMRNLGKSRTELYSQVSWVEGTGEKTNLAEGIFDLITFGSSFNVTNQMEALKESARLLKSQGWFACMWNHRDLTDEIQKEVEKIIFSKSVFVLNCLPKFP